MRPIHVFILLIICNVICNLALSIIAPFFPSFAKSKGISEEIIGLIFAAHPLGQFIASFILGKFITHNNRGNLMNAGILCQGLGLLIFGLLYYLDSKVFVIIGGLVGRLLGGMGASLFMTPFYAFIPELFPESIEQKIAISEVTTSLGYLIGPLMGSALFRLGGFILPFFVFSGCSFILGVTLFVLSDNFKIIDRDEYSILKKSLKSQSTVDQTFRISYISLLFNYPVVISYFMCTMTQCIWAFYNPTFAIYLKDQYSINESYSGYYISINAATFGLASLIVSRIKRLRKFWMFYGFVLSGYFQLFMGPDYEYTKLHPKTIYTIAAWSISGFTAGFPYILTLPQINSILLEDYSKYPTQCANIASALQNFMNIRFTASIAGGGLFGPIAGGYLTQFYGFERAASLLGFIILSIATLYLPYLYMIEKNRKTMNKIEMKK